MERDDLIVNDSYALNAHHSEEEGKAIRKKIWLVTIILTVITALEVGVGIALPKSGFGADGGMTWSAIKWGYIALTLLKAGYIVMVFMHLGDERKSLRRFILWPYFIFILYLTFQLLVEGSYVGQMYDTFLS